MDTGAWWVTVHGVAKSRTQLITERAQACRNEDPEQPPKIINSGSLWFQLHALSAHWKPLAFLE